ncbi:tetratricopeptide repeat protein [Streptosporangium canum]|uniref:tetratricopeptide repeat protein n=1 Tax=Streptosporangium canum TaxID=324952 RepID=UPI0033BB1A20
MSELTAPQSVELTASGERSIAAHTFSGIGINGDHNEITVLERGTLQAPAWVTAGKGVCFLPREPAAVFVGREQVLAVLRQALEDDHAQVVISQVVYGLGGVGKSELALQYAAAHRDRYAVVWWITADSVAQIQSGLAALAGRLHPPVRLAGTVEDAADWVIGWLQTHSGWLLVLDNVEDPEHVRPLLGQLSGGRMVITTRRDVRWGGQRRPVRLDVLEPGPAVELIFQITGGERQAGDEVVAADLATKLGFLPLALEQAASYIKQNRISLTRYLARLQEHPARVHARIAEGDQAERTIARLWQITMKMIESRNSDAIELLRALACYASDDIPRQVVPEEIGATDTGEALGLLASYSMITLTEEAVSMHRLTQAVVLTDASDDSLGRIGAARNTALTWLASALPQDPRSDLTGWPLWRRLMPHIDAFAARYLPGGEPADLEIILNQAAIFQLVQGAHHHAAALATHALAIAEAAYGSDHPAVADSLANLAASFRDLGCPGEAMPLFERALAINEAAYGPDAPAVATSLGNLANSLRDLGRPGESVSLEQRAAAIIEAAYGPDHPGVATSLGHLANSFRDLGRPGEAMPLFERALAITEAAYGPDHPTVAIRLNNLAATFRALGQPDESVSLEQRALAIIQAAYGPDHPTVATSLSHLAAAFSDLGRPGEAVPLFERALAINEAAYGPDHPTVATSLNNLAASFRALGRPGESVSLEQRAAAIIEAAYGPDHPTVAILLSNLAVSFSDLGRPSEAVPLFERVLTINQAAYGPDHPTVATSLNNLAASFHALGRPGESVSLEQRAAAIIEAAYGPDHPTVATSLSNLAASFRDLGRPDESVPLEQRALAIIEAAYGSTHPALVVVLSNLASSFNDLGRPSEAVPLFERALTITEAAYGSTHPTVAIVLSNLTNSFRALGRPGKAVSLLERALAITETAYGSTHPSLAIVLGNLANSFNDLGRPSEAIPLFERALTITEAAYGSTHPTITTLRRALSYAMNAPCHCGSGRKFKRCHGSIPSPAP